jgi:hypothetical protein
MTEVIIKSKIIGNEISSNGRVRIENYSLKARAIKKIYFADSYFYIVYETDNAQYYKKLGLLSKLPANAVELRFHIRTVEHWPDYADDIETRDKELIIDEKEIVYAGKQYKIDCFNLLWIAKQK